MLESHASAGHGSLPAEASRALARLDADRLERIVLTCSALSEEACSQAVSSEPQRWAHEMAILAGVMEATRGNRNVLDRLTGVRPSGYGPAGQWTETGSRHGND